MFADTGVDTRLTVRIAAANEVFYSGWNSVLGNINNIIYLLDTQ